MDFYFSLNLTIPFKRSMKWLEVYKDSCIENVIVLLFIRSTVDIHLADV